jgi:hypothetical protein
MPGIPMLHPSWLTHTVRILAEGIYADQALDRLPILGDALQDAGCENWDSLDHCRGEGPHFRGCWVYDRPNHVGASRKRTAVTRYVRS